MEFFITAMGIKQAQFKSRALGAAAIDVSPAFMVVAEEMMAIEETVFSSQGRRGGGSWAALTTEWLTRKVREGLDPRINIASYALIDSVTQRGAAGQVLEIFPDRMYFGSDLPQAAPSQRERPFIKFTLGDRALFRNVIKEHFMAAWRSA